MKKAENSWLSENSKVVSYILKAVVIISALAGTFMSLGAGRRAFMGGSRVFMYYMIQSNIAIAVICLIGTVLMLRRQPVPNWWYTVKFVGTVAITLTGVVYCTMIAPLLGDFAWRLNNVLTHVVVPLAAIIDFFVTGVDGAIPRRSVFLVTIPPAAYAVYAGIGYIAGWEFSDGANYPYFFLNWGSPAGAIGFTNELPFMGCVWWILAIFLFLIGIGYIYLLILDRIKAQAK
ncbi:MAG: Pr6Pr family membrane protein [Clostridia bacterium]|nr:Pr6Pr family membrane protein [Clostridia bacterium]